MPSPSRTAEAPAAARSLVLTSGKGGVGTSNLALNLAIALGEYGQRVVLVDADLGLANIDLLCGLTPESDLGDVLAGDCSLAEAVVTGPGDVRIVPGAHGTRTLVDALGDGPTRLVADLAELEAGADFLLIDAGSGLGPGVATRAAAADQVVIVTTPEPTSVADAHAAIGRFRRLVGPPAAAGGGQPGGLGRRGARRPRPPQRVEPAVPRDGRRGAGARPGRPPRPAGGPDATPVRGGLSPLRGLARGAAAGPRPDRGRPAPRPSSRLLRLAVGALGAEPGRPLSGRAGRARRGRDPDGFRF